MNKNISISLPEELWQEIDKLRGAVSRSAWVRGAVEFRLVADKSPATPLVVPESLKSKTRRQSGDTDFMEGATFDPESYGAVVVPGYAAPLKIKKFYDQQCQREEVMPGERIPTGRTSPSIAEGGAAQSRSSAPPLKPKKIGPKSSAAEQRKEAERLVGILDPEGQAGLQGRLDDWLAALPSRKKFTAWGLVLKLRRYIEVEKDYGLEPILKMIRLGTERQWTDVDVDNWLRQSSPPRKTKRLAVQQEVMTDPEGLEIWQALKAELQTEVLYAKSYELTPLLDILVPVAIERDRSEQYYPVDVVVRAPNEHIRYMIEQEMAADGRRSIITAACEAANIGLRWEQPKRS